MSILAALGKSSPAAPLPPEVEAELLDELDRSWGPLSLAWKQAITPAQLEELLAGVLHRFKTKHPTASSHEAILVLLNQTIPNNQSGGGGGTQIYISQLADNILKMVSDGLYVPNKVVWKSNDW